MNQERVKLIIKNLELLFQSLKDELNEKEEYEFYEDIAPYLDNDVDEFYDDKTDV